MEAPLVIPMSQRLQAGCCGRLARTGVSVLLMFALFAAHLARAQNDEDQGWAQFSRENTLRGTVVSAAPVGKNDGSFAVKTDGGQQWKVLYGVNTRLMRGRDQVRATEIQTGDMIFAAGNLDAK